MEDDNHYQSISISDDTPVEELLEGECYNVEEDVMEEDEVQAEDVITYEAQYYDSSSPEPSPPAVVVNTPIMKQTPPTIIKQSLLVKTQGGAANKPTSTVPSTFTQPAVKYRMLAPKITTIPVTPVSNSGSVIVISRKAGAEVKPGNLSNSQPHSVFGKTATAAEGPPLVIKDIRQCKPFTGDSLANLKIKLDYVDRMLKTQQTLLGKLRGRSLFLSKDNYRLKKSIGELKWIVAEQNKSAPPPAVEPASVDDQNVLAINDEEQDESFGFSADAQSCLLSPEPVTDD